MSHKRSLVALFKKQHGLCHYCREPMVMGGAGPSGATRDHVWPKARGGMGGKNIVAACRYCNETKGDMRPKQFLKMIPETMAGKGSYQDIRRAVRKSRKTELNARADAILTGQTNR